MFEKVIQYFKEICSIPHGSGNTEKLCDFCEGFAVSHNLSYKRDSAGNIVIFKDGTKGYEKSPSVILQGHLDMVCVKEEDCDIKFLTDGLRLKEDGDYIFADGTSLGGDAGIAIAYALAVLDSTAISHPPLEVVFTTDEETGMEGAKALDLSSLSSEMLINIDSENEGTILVSCAGGIRADVRFDGNLINENQKALSVFLSGLTGGHSGTEIHKNRLNAICELAKLLSVSGNFSLSSFSGGSADNAIPSFAKATVIPENEELFLKELSRNYETLKEKALHTDPLISLEFTECEASSFFAPSVSKKIAEAAATVFNGVIAFSENIDGLVETSLNLGTAKTENGSVSFCHALRSSVTEEKEKLCEKLKKHYEAFGFSCNFHSDYPAWEYKENSRLQSVFKESYKDLTGNDLKISAIHAGLECGLFTSKRPDLDCISFGPNMKDIHSVKEKLSISSSKRTFELLIKVLERLT